MSKNTYLSGHLQKEVYDELRVASNYTLYNLRLFEGVDENIKGLTCNWTYAYFFRFMLEFESLQQDELLICAAYHTRLITEIPFNKEEKKNNLMYGRSIPQNKYNVARPKNSRGWMTTYERDYSDLYFLVKSVFFFRYTASLVRLQTATYKKRLRELIDNMDFAVIYEGVKELPKSEEKDKLQKLLIEPIPGFRVKYGRRDVSLKEYFNV